MSATPEWHHITQCAISRRPDADAGVGTESRRPARLGTSGAGLGLQLVVR